MLAGQRPAECNACWRLEDAGLESDRQIKNRTLDFYLDRDIDFLYQDCAQGLNKTVYYKIDSGSTCNGTCIMCNGESSSAWAQLERKYAGREYSDSTLTTDQADRVVDYKHAKFITFTGGEPFLNETNFYIIEQLIKHNNTNCFLSFVTNGSFKLKDEQKTNLLRFKNINFCFSIDGVGPVFEYTRYPLKWDDIERNISWCRENSIDISVSYTVTNVNILYHRETVQWFKDNNLPYIINVVNNPWYLRPTSLPENILEELHKDSELTSMLNGPADNSARWTEEFLKRIQQQDQWKKIRMRDYLPKLAQLLGFTK